MVADQDRIEADGLGVDREVEQLAGRELLGRGLVPELEHGASPRRGLVGAGPWMPRPASAPSPAVAQCAVSVWSLAAPSSVVVRVAPRSVPRCRRRPNTPDWSLTRDRCVDALIAASRRRRGRSPTRSPRSGRPRHDLDALLAAARARRDLAHACRRELLAKGLHPAHPALPRRLPLLHLRARPARAGRALSLDRRGGGDRPQAGARPAATRRCSRSATSPSAATASRARRWPRIGHATTIDYLAAVARRVHEATGLLPHVNPGVMTRAELGALRAVSASAGLMLEIDVGAALRARRSALRLPRQAPGRPPRDHPTRPASRRCRSPAGS